MRHQQIDESGDEGFSGFSPLNGTRAGRIILLGDGTEVLTGVTDDEMFEYEDDKPEKPALEPSPNKEGPTLALPEPPKAEPNAEGPGPSTNSDEQQQQQESANKESTAAGSPPAAEKPPANAPTSTDTPPSS